MSEGDEKLIRELEQIEAKIRRMISGVLYFLIQGLPAWIGKVWKHSLAWLGEFAESFVKISVKLARVGFCAAIWAALVFGVLVLALFGGAGAWTIVGTMLWTCIAMAGSLWGLNRIRARMKDAAHLKPVERRRVPTQLNQQQFSNNQRNRLGSH